MASGLPADPVSGAPPVAEHPRPPGWMPPVHPPPAPVAAAPAVFRPTSPPPVLPHPTRPARPAPPVAPPRRPGGFPVLAFVLACLIIEPVGDLLSAGLPADLAQGVARMAEVASLAIKAALVVGLWRFESWVSRAAFSWAASLVLLRVLRAVENPAYYPDVETFLGELLLSLILPAMVVIFVWDGSRGLAPPPSP